MSLCRSKVEPGLAVAAIVPETRKVVDCAIFPRDKETAEELWFSLSSGYHQWAVSFTDFYQVYAVSCRRNGTKPLTKLAGRRA